MNSIKHSFKGYFIEFLIVFLGIVTSFFIDNRVKLNEKIETKNILLQEFLLKMDEDTVQLEKIQEILARCMESSEQLIDDFYNKTLSKDALANEFLYISQNIGISFFPQRGIYDQMLTSGNIELIKSKELQVALAKIFEHYSERNKAINQAIDNFHLSTFQRMYDDIVVFSEPSEENKLIYSGSRVRFYDISEGYYRSRLIPYCYAESQNLIRFYSDLMENYALGFEELKDLIKEELRN